MGSDITITLPAAREATDVHDHEGVNTVPADCAAECGQDVSDGDPMRKVGDGWLHERCAIKAITSADVDAAWLLLADQVVARPSAFRASDVKAVMANVARIARRAS